MSRLTQRAPASPKHLSLPPGQLGASDKISWLPEGRVFSNVQREKISKFLKGSVLKRVFGSQQMRWEGPNSQKKDSSPTFPDIRKEAKAQLVSAEMLTQQAEGLEEDARQDTWTSGAEGTVRRHRRSYTKVGRSNVENTDLHPSTISQESPSQWNLDSEVLIPENKSLSSGKDSVAGGKINKNQLEIPAQELMLDLPLPENAPSRTQQNSNQGIFQLWSHPSHEENTMGNRESQKSSEETGFNVANSPTKPFMLNHSNTPDSKHIGSYPGLSMPVGLCWPYADGDFLKDREEFRIDSCSIEESNGDSLSTPNWNLKYGNNNVEENVTDESDLSENEKMNDTLFSYFKNMDLTLKPEAIENVEESFTEEPSEIFVYADFLPAPFNTLDLHKFALSKCENWKTIVGPPESSTEQLITRLLELERLQHMTIQKERPRLQSTFCTQVILERPSSSKAAVPKTRQPKPPDTLNLPIPNVDKNREKRKNNSGSGKLEQNAPKWNWNSSGKYRFNSKPSLKCPPTTKQLAASHDDTKNSKSSTLNPCQELPPKPATAQTQPLVKMASTRCLPPRSPLPVSPIPLSFPENHREEIRAPRTKKKLPRKSILTNRPLYIQKLNCLSASFITKGKCSPIDQK